jgi:putative oxidoreductase
MTAYRSMARSLTGLSDWPLLALRCMIGWLMILHALYKFTIGLGVFQKVLLDPTGLPLTGELRWFVPWMEIVFGTLLILGLFTRVAAAVLGVEMVFTAFLVKLSVLHTGVIGAHGSGGAEIDLLALATLLLVVFTGPGKISLDALARLDAPVKPIDARPAAPAESQTRTVNAL